MCCLSPILLGTATLHSDGGSQGGHCCPHERARWSRYGPLTQLGFGESELGVSPSCVRSSCGRRGGRVSALFSCHRRGVLGEAENPSSASLVPFSGPTASLALSSVVLHSLIPASKFPLPKQKLHLCTLQPRALINTQADLPRYVMSSV